MSVGIFRKSAEIADDVKKGGEIPSKPIKPSPKATIEKLGKEIRPSDLKMPHIRGVFLKAARDYLDLKKLGINENELEKVFAEALRRLTKDQNKITVSQWLGEIFETLAPNHPDVIEIRNSVLKEALELANEALGKPDAFFNFKGKSIYLNERFTDITMIRSLWISDKKFCDMAILAKTKSGKYVLLVTEEYKTQGVKLKELDVQQAARNSRIFDDAHLTDVKLKFTKFSSKNESEINLSQVLLNSFNPGGRIGIKNSSQAILDVRFPKKKGERAVYIRRGISMQTKGMRAVLQKIVNML